MFGIELLAKLVKILRSGASPTQIAAGFIIGMIIGLTPFWTLHNVILIVILVIVNINIGTAIFSFLLFSAIAYLADPLFHSFGYFLLVDMESLRDFWTYLYNLPLVALSRYNNTVVTGSLAIALIITLPFYFMAKIGVIYYRENIDSKIQKWKLVQAIKGSKIYSFYEKIRNLGD
jgi:uncharacterized protein (TIGR03546 family)